MILPYVLQNVALSMLFLAADDRTPITGVTICTVAIEHGRWFMISNAHGLLHTRAALSLMKSVPAEATLQPGRQSG